MFDFIAGWLQEGGLLAVGALMLLENVFPPIPSELVMPLAGFLAGQGSMSVAGVVLAGTAGSVLGALFWYWLARAWGRERFLRFIDRWGVWLTLSREEAEGAVGWFERNGRAAVLFGRMVPAIRTLISIPAGLSGMALGPFLLLTAAGSALWTLALAAAGLVLRENYEAVERWLNPVTTLLVLLVAGLYVVRVARGLLRRRR